MNDALAVSSTTLPLVQPTNFGARMAALPMRAKLSMGLGLMALAGVVLAMTLWSSKGDYKVLYANLSDKDGGAVIAQLSQMNVPYRISDGGTAIMVPSGQVHDLRLKLATAGLPKGSTTGYELMDNARFGQTQFQERLTAQRGLEGELVRSITSLAAVENARVHLALPNQNGFFREQQKPSASVLLSLRSGQSLDRAQIAGIVHLVSSSVPELDPKAVSVLDQSGALLTQSADNPGAGLDAQQLAYVNQIESGYQKRIMELLEPVVGRDNLRATVTADIDFSQTEATSEEFRPNQGAEAKTTIRSQQVSESGGPNAAQPSGVPGASSNQPPVGATAPLTGASQPLQTAQNGGGTAGANGKRDATTNYEVDKTVRVTRASTGNVRRLNAAVVVNDRTSTDAKGKVKNTPLSNEEVEKLTALVRQGIGFNTDRGDSVKVINAPFKVEQIKVDEIPMWKQPEVTDLLRSLAVPAGLALIGLLVFFGLVRPALKAALAPPPALPAPEPGAQLAEIVDDTNELPALPAPKSATHLASARQLAKDNPAAVAGIVRGWVTSGAAPVANKST